MYNSFPISPNLILTGAYPSPNPYGYFSEGVLYGTWADVSFQPRNRETIQYVIILNWRWFRQFYYLNIY